MTRVGLQRHSKKIFNLNVFFNISHPVMFLIFNKMVYSVLKQLQYISFLATNHLQANVNHREVHSVCTYIMGSDSVYIKS
jgi:hypothetical protein